MLARYQSEVAAALQLDNDPQHGFSIAYADLSLQPGRAFVETIPATKFATLMQRLGLAIENLDPDPDVGSMTAPRRGTNVERKKRIQRLFSGWQSPLSRGDRATLVAMLEQLRKASSSWVVPRLAGGMAILIDDALGELKIGNVP